MKQCAVYCGVKMALGLFEHPYPEGSEVTSAVAEHRRPGARGCGGVVCFAAEPSGEERCYGTSTYEDGKRSHLSARSPITPQRCRGRGEERIALPDVVTLKDAMETRAKQTGTTLLYAKGTDFLTQSEAGFAEAEGIAKHADVVVMALGESSSMSGEAGSRSNLDLPGNQQQLLERVAATGKPVVLLVFSGRPLVLTWAAQHVPRDYGSLVSRYRSRQRTRPACSMAMCRPAASCR